MAWRDLCLPTARTPNSSEWFGGYSSPLALPRGRAIHTPLIPLTGTLLATPHFGDSGDPQASASVWPGTGHSWGRSASLQTQGHSREGNEGGRGLETLTWLEACLGGRKHRKARPSAVGKASKPPWHLCGFRTTGASPWPPSPGLWPGGWGEGPDWVTP